MTNDEQQHAPVRLHESATTADAPADESGDTPADARTDAPDDTPADVSGDAPDETSGRQHHEFGLPRYDEIPPELSEALRSLVNRYELRMGAPVPSSIAVTAAPSSTGSTAVSAALATMLAYEMGRHVCWFDCSWMAARDEQEVDDGSDLLELLADHSRLSSALRESPDTDTLVSLSFGPVPDEQRNRVASSPGFEGLVKILDDEYDHVIYDVPPILESANAVGVLRQTDASLIVARHRATTVADVELAVDATRPTPTLGVVLTEYRPKIPRRIQRLLTS